VSWGFKGSGFLGFWGWVFLIYPADLPQGIPYIPVGGSICKTASFDCCF